MKYGTEKLGLLVAIVAAIAAVLLVSVGAVVTTEESIQKQGEEFIDLTIEEIQELPEELEKTEEQIKEEVSDLPEVIRK